MKFNYSLANFFFLFFCVCSIQSATTSYAQSVHVFEDWVTNSGTQNFFYKNVSKQDGSGNIYVLGATLNGAGNYDILLAKYNNTNTMLWSVTYAGAAGMDDIGADLMVDASGNVFVTGTAIQSVSDSYDLVLIKYNSSGTQQWVSFYNNTFGTPVAYDAGTSLTQDNSGNIYVAGGSFGNGTGADYVTVKFNSLGMQQWAYRYNYNGNNDLATKIQYQASTSKLTVVGGSQSSSSNWDFAVISYDLTGLSAPVIQRYSGTADGVDEVTDMATDAAGNIYITGTSKYLGSGFDIKTIKLNASLALQWSVTHNGAGNGDDKASAIQVDNAGNVFIAGYVSTSTQGKDYVLLRYNSAGVEQWVRYYNGENNLDDEANALTLDASGNIYVTGKSYFKQNFDFYTIKYNSAGSVRWTIAYNGLGNGNDNPSGIALDNGGNIIVSGQTLGPEGEYTYTTLRYKEVLLYAVPNEEAIPNTFECVENRGQLLGTNGSPIDEIKYYAESFPSLYFTANKACMVWAKSDTVAADTLYRVDMVLKKGKAGNCYPMNAYPWHHNFYLGHLVKGLERVQAYNTMVYPNVYSNIDAFFTANNAGIKVFFVIKPGGSPSSISIEFSGASSLTVGGSGDLMVGNTLENLILKKAKAFQIDGSGNKVPLAWQPTYTVTGGNTLTFTGVGTYNSAQPLVFEVYEHEELAITAVDNLQWSTYYGGSLDDVANDVATDDNGNLFVCGRTRSSNFPVTLNQSVGTPSANAFLLKFGENRVRQWATKFGGSAAADNEAKHLAINGSGQVFMNGRTTATNFPIIPLTGAYNATGFVGGSFMGRANNGTGVLEWTSFFTGNQNKMLFNDNNELYMVGDGGNNNLPLLNPGGGAYYNTQGGGTITKFGTALQVVYCTRFGSTTLASLQTVAKGPDNTVYVAGYSMGDNVPILATGSQYSQNFVPSTPASSCSGCPDGVVLQLGPANNLLWSTFLGGDGNDWVFDATSVYGDALGFQLYLVGGTTAINFPVQQTSNSFFQATYGSAQPNSGDGFISRFNGGNELMYSTYYGGDNRDRFHGIDANDDGRIFITGYSNSTNFNTEAPNSYYEQTLLDGGDNNLSGDAVVIGSYNDDVFWSTYFGGKAAEWGWGIALGNNDQVYVVGQTQSPQDLATSTYRFPLKNPGNNAYFQNLLNQTTASPVTPMMDAFVSEFATYTQFSILESTIGKTILVYPNPATSQLNFNLPSGMQITDIQVINNLGQTVWNAPFTSVIDISSLNSGIYFVRLLNDNNVLSVNKFVKQ